MNNFIEALRGKRPRTTPVWFMRQAGRFLKEYRQIREKVKNFFELCRNVELSVEITALPVKKLGVDAAILFSDLLVPLLPLKSMNVQLKESVGPVIELKKQLNKPEELIHSYSVEEKLSFVGQIVKEFKSFFPKIPIIGFCGAPFTLLSYIVEGGGSKNYTKTKIFMQENPEIFFKLSERLTEILSRYALMQIKHGADAFQVFDSWAGALSPYDYESFVLPHTKKLVEKIKKAGVPVIYFSTGTSGILGVVKKIPADAFSIDWRIRLKDAAQILDRNTTIQGNLDPAALFAPKERLAKLTKDIINEGKAFRAHVFNLGHGILPSTNPDTVKWLVDFIHGL